MDTTTQPIPKGYHSITPYLMVTDAEKALEFYQKAFDAKLITRTNTTSGNIGHCELQIGDSRFMFSGPGFMPVAAPSTSSSLLIYVPNVDEFFKHALAAGASEVHAVENQFYGDRMGTLKDPFGHLWHIGTHIEDVSQDETQKRALEKWKH